MSFEEQFNNQHQLLPIHLTEHRLRSVTEKNTACLYCYPPPANNKLPQSFINFARWICNNHFAYQFSGYTVTAFQVYLVKFRKDFVTGPLSESTTKAAHKVLLSNGYTRKPNPILLLLYFLNLTNRTNYFQQEVTTGLLAQLTTELRETDQIYSPLHLQLQQHLQILWPMRMQLEML